MKQNIRNKNFNFHQTDDFFNSDDTTASNYMHLDSIPNAQTDINADPNLEFEFRHDSVTGSGIDVTIIYFTITEWHQLGIRQPFFPHLEQILKKKKPLS